MINQPAYFSDLAKSAWAHVKERHSVLLIAIVVFTVIMLVLPVAAVALLALAGFSSFVLSEGTELGPEMIGALIATAIVIGIVSGLVGLYSYLFYLLAVVRKASFGAIAKEAFAKFLPFLGLNILIGLRSFVWVSLLGVPLYYLGAQDEGNPMYVMLATILVIAGVVLAFVYMPRLILAPVVWLVEKLSVSAAIDRSIAVTKGYWGKIVGNVLLLNIIFMLFMMVVSLITGILGAASEDIGSLVSSIASTFFSQYFQAIFAAFLLLLSGELIAHPRTGAVKTMKASAPAKTVSKKAPAKKKSK